MAESCRFCDSKPVAVFAFDSGCVCYPEDRRQALCMQHVVRATPLGSMQLAQDLTCDGAFGDWWRRHRCGVPG
jgi:hypothetical protein